MTSSQAAALLMDHSLDSVVRGHHVYKQDWQPNEGEELRVEREEGNAHDSHAISIIKDSAVVGHLPIELSRIFWHFIRHGGVVTCEITGHRKKGKGLEVPCRYMFTGRRKFIMKLKHLITSTNTYFDSCPY